MTFIDDIVTYLKTNNISNDIHKHGFASGVPNDIAVNPPPGILGKYSASGDMKLEKPSLQILVRNQAGGTAESKANEIYNLLNLTVNKRIGGTRFKRIEAQSPPFFVSKSKAEGTIYSINFSLQIDERS